MSVDDELEPMMGGAMVLLQDIGASLDGRADLVRDAVDILRDDSETAGCKADGQAAALWLLWQARTHTYIDTRGYRRLRTKVLGWEIDS